MLEHSKKAISTIHFVKSHLFHQISIFLYKRQDFLKYLVTSSFNEVVFNSFFLFQLTNGYISNTQKFYISLFVFMQQNNRSSFTACSTTSSTTMTKGFRILWRIKLERISQTIFCVKNIYLNDNINVW